MGNNTLVVAYTNKQIGSIFFFSLYRLTRQVLTQAKINTMTSVAR